MQRLVLFILIALTLLPAAPARACSTCQCGDPTLTIMGTEKPFAGRLRVAAEFRYRTEEVGIIGITGEELAEYRTTFSAAWTPIERLTVGLSVPAVGKKLERANLATEDTFFLGDIELVARGYLWQDREMRPRHLIALVAGVRMPSAPELDDAFGTPLSLDTQPGTGAFIGSAGLSYGLYLHPFSFYASSTGVFAGGGFGAFQAGNAWLNTALVQWAPDFPVALQLGFDSRAAARDETAGVKEPDSGGFIGFLTPGVVFSPAEDLLLAMRVMIPVADALHGNHDEGIAVLAGVTYDL